jgi:hypothetical protein
VHILQLIIRSVILDAAAPRHAWTSRAGTRFAFLKKNSEGCAATVRLVSPAPPDLGSFMCRRVSQILLGLALLICLPGPVAWADDAEDASPGHLHSWEALVHFRLPGGGEEIVRLEDFCFVYYERQYKKTASKLGGPRSLEVRDLPREVMSIQNESLDRLRFWKIASIRIEYRSEGSARRLYLVATPSAPGKKPILWPADSLRNASTSQTPHFQGRRGGEVVEVLLPPLIEASTLEGKVLTGIDLKFDGQKKHRSWL